MLIRFVHVSVINLKERNEKREYMKKMLKNMNIEYTLFSAEKHSNPKRGCLESHLSIIKNALKENYKYIHLVK